MSKPSSPTLLAHPLQKIWLQSNSYSRGAATWVGGVLVVFLGSADLALAVFLLTPDALVMERAQALDLCLSLAT